MASDLDNWNVENWLKELNLMKYKQAFIDNGYDTALLCVNLNEEDLDAIGVMDKQHRSTLLNMALEKEGEKDGVVRKGPYEAAIEGTAILKGSLSPKIQPETVSVLTEDEQQRDDIANPVPNTQQPEFATLSIPLAATVQECSSLVSAVKKAPDDDHWDKELTKKISQDDQSLNRNRAEESAVEEPLEGEEPPSLFVRSVPPSESVAEAHEGHPERSSLVVGERESARKPSEEEQFTSKERPLVVPGLPPLRRVGENKFYEIPGLDGVPCHFKEGRDWHIDKDLSGEDVFIGKGCYGSCYRAHAAECNTTMVVKKPILGEEQTTEEVQKEISALADLNYPSIIQFLGATFENGVFNIFMKWMSGGTLSECMKTRYVQPEKEMGETAVLSFGKQLMLAIRHIHSENIVHGDVGANNILVDETGRRLCLADFGNTSSYRKLDSDGRLRTNSDLYKDDVRECGYVVCQMMALPSELERSYLMKEEDFNEILSAKRFENQAVFIELVGDCCCISKDTALGELEERFDKLSLLQPNVFVNT